MEKKWKIIRVIPILLAVGFVPLIVTAKKYDIGLNCFDWFSDSDSSIDLFLYWKGQGLILLAFLMLLFAAVSRMGKKKDSLSGRSSGYRRWHGWHFIWFWRFCQHSFLPIGILRCGEAMNSGRA